MTHLRQAVLEELQQRNYAKTTVHYYIQAVERFAKYCRKPPDRLNQSHLRTYQAYLLCERKLGPRTVKLHVSALRFFFVKTLKRPYILEDIPFPKVPRRLPAILTTDEVTRLIDGARNLTDRTMLMVLYSTGMRVAAAIEHRKSSISFVVTTDCQPVPGGRLLNLAEGPRQRLCHMSRTETSQCGAALQRLLSTLYGTLFGAVAVGTGFGNARRGRRSARLAAW